MREHVIVAMVGKDPVKVECTSCDGQHRYRAAPPGTKREAKPRTERTSSRASGTTRRRDSSSASSAPEASVDFEAKLNARPAQPYHPDRTYVLDDVLDHPSFGRGLVVALPGPQKIEVQFAGERKLLLHDKGATKDLMLKRPPPRGDDGAPADAPPLDRRL